ncbi:MAG TPA: hypothetical protein VNA20_14895 [Frankiaceae bacterium]|nr:hypothetical protein [Frankiaceae bacterium]
MTTSDDDRGSAYVENDGGTGPAGGSLPGEPLAGTTHADPLGGDAAPVAADARPGGGRLVAAILASLGVVVVGVALWSYIYVQAEREYVGVSVVIGLIVGYVMRLVSGRSTVPVRIIAVLITALACVLGTVAGEAAFTANAYDASFFDLFKDILPDSFELVKRRPGLTFAIFGAALVLAFLSASPQDSKKKRKGSDEPPASVVEPVDDAPPPHATDG